MRAPAVIQAWFDTTAVIVPAELEVWDSHTHTGQNDPDGFTNTDTELIAALDAAGHAGAVVMTSADPNRFGEANRRVLEEARGSAGRLVSLARIDPNHDDASVVERALAAGHRGFKLHPRSETFGMEHPMVTEVCRVAAEASAPVLVHSGRGIPSLRRAVLRLLDEFDGLRIVLAHCAISDLARLGPEASNHPGLYFDCSWWDITDRLALAAWVSPSRILYASDTPYGHPLMSFAMAARTAAAAGYDERQMRAHFGGTLRGLLLGDDGTVRDEPPGDGFIRADAGLMRVHASIHTAIGALLVDGDPSEPMSLARAGCDVDPRVGDVDVYRAIGATLDAVDFAERRNSFRLLVIAAAAALTPQVPVPDLGL